MSALCSTRAADWKPTGRELLDWQNEFNTGVNKIGWVMERVIVRFKNWTIFRGRPDLRQRRRGLLTECRTARAARARGKQEPTHG
jgi:hypothetical protein